MKKINKGLITLAGASIMGLALASCGSSKSTRNSSIPYANVYNSDTVIATATNDITNSEMSMTLAQFYSRLRYSGYTLVTTNIKKTMYQNEYNAVKELLLNETLNANVSETTRNLLVVSKNDTLLYNLTDTTLDYTNSKNNYEYIRYQYIKSLSSSLSAAIFSSSSAKAIAAFEDDDIEKSLNKYIEARQREGITLTKADLEYQMPTDDSDVLVFTNLSSLITNHETLLRNYLVNLAEKIATKQALYKIADDEYIYKYDVDPTSGQKTKNSNLIYDEDKIKSSYDATFKKYGTYQAVVIQFNSRRDALNAIDTVKDDLGYTLADLDETAADYKEKAEAFYKELYNLCYEYNTVTSLNDERFLYTITPNKNGLDDLNNSTISNLITDTLENGDFFVEPRNISNKYMMIYRITSEYDLSGTDTAKEYDDLTDVEKAKYDVMVKYNILDSKYSSYTSTVYDSNIYNLMNDDDASNDLMIYDPLMEYKYNSSYSNVYKLMNKKYFKDNAIFSYNGVDYTVADFYNDAKNAYGTSVLTEYFQLEYAYSYSDNTDYLDSDTHSSNSDELDSAIKTFNKDGNTTYPKAMGLSNYLLAAYGYETKADVLKYYYDASACLSAYKAKKVFENWATLDNEKTEEVGSNAYKLSEDATTGFLNNLLATGNAKYSKLFNIDLDHILIYVDFDGDGSPDDPADFLKKQDDATQLRFKNAVTELAKAVYVEATSGLYGDSNSLFTILSYIKTAYEEGAKLKTDPTKSWDDYKEFQFLLKAEQLASSGDITQDSVSSFVEPFANYVKGVYSSLKKIEGNESSKSYTNGLFYVYEGNDEGHKLTTESDKDYITFDSLCSTVYGYHLLLVNDYSGPNSISYKATDDEDYQKNLSILLIKADDEDDNVVVYISSENSETTSANLNQFFIYYVQSANGSTSSLPEKIKTLMSTLFDDVISTYTSSNFQTYLLLSKLNIKLSDTDYKPAIVAPQNGVDVDYYANQVTSYGEKEEYASWVDGTYSWDRPTK